jgi:glycosyltransferase involved in cell wall biosynthesis
MSSLGRKLLVVSGAFPPDNSGEAQHALLLSRELARRGLEVTVLTNVGAVDDGSVEVWPLMQEWSWRELPLFASSLKSSSPDVVLLLYIGWIYNDHPMVTYAPTIARFLRCRVRFVTQFENAIGAVPERHGLVVRLPTRAIGAATGLWNVGYRFGTLLRDSDRIIILSRHHLSILTGLVGSVRDRSVLIPPPPLMEIAPDTEEVRQRGREMLRVEREHCVVVYLGYLYPRKGLETLLRGFAIVAKKHENAMLAIVGGPLEGFEHYALGIRDLSAGLGIEDKVRWTGAYPWDSPDGSTMLRASDVYVLPIDVGVALNNSSIGAAAAHGLPLIATEGANTERAFRDGENILLCPPEDPSAMAAAIETVLEDDDLRQHLARGAKALADRWFSWQTAVDRTLATLVD